MRTADAARNPGMPSSFTCQGPLQRRCGTELGIGSSRSFSASGAGGLRMSASCTACSFAQSAPLALLAQLTGLPAPLLSRFDLIFGLRGGKNSARPLLKTKLA